MIASSLANSRSFVLPSLSSIESFFCYTHFLPFLSFAVPAMAQTKSTAHPPYSSRNPPPNTRRVTIGTNPPPTRNPPRASGAPSSQAERPASSRANLTQATPPQAGGVSLPSQDYKKLYPWASPILLKETSSINTDVGVHRLRKGVKLTYHFTRSTIAK